ncbi:MAG: 4-hydroxythreonine-4-phosphate dehydrogenase PdxA [Pirellulaceae bacterium]|nr:4-hydroxythreonine-4-phosphate dehydrogenase PdxA [Pirellulaceae bacterium]
MTHLPAIALTMGDPAGVGPELVLRALAEEQIGRCCRLIVFGDRAVLRRCCEITGLPLPNCLVIPLRQFRQSGPGAPSSPVTIVDDPHIDLSSFQPGRLDRTCGQAAFEFIQTSIDAALAGQVDAVVTLPINKEALQLAGHNYPGHTEMFAERSAASDRWCMMQYSEKITCTFVTVHCGYSQVPQLLSVQRILDTIMLTDQALRQIRNRPPRLLVCGLNPHAGEHGLFGNGEEEQLIVPAIELARQQGVILEGPLPPDTAFLPNKLAGCDAVVCMYHDQGHIPVKALAFDSAVNTTLGLSIVRTSVDHGTAFDIAWQGQAQPNSLFAAIRLAAQLSKPAVESEI